MEVIKKIASEWKLLGIHLGIEEHELEEIQYNCKDQVQVCRKEMIISWIKTKSATLDKLIKALTIIKRNDLVKDLMDYKQSYV